MVSSVGFVPGTITRWRERCFVVVDCDGMDTIIGVARSTRIAVKATDPFDSPMKIVVRKGVDRVNGRAHWSMITNLYPSFANSVIASFASKVIQDVSIRK
jgi:hypothetical protein